MQGYDGLWWAIGRSAESSEEYIFQNPDLLGRKFLQKIINSP